MAMSNNIWLNSPIDEDSVKKLEHVAENHPIITSSELNVINDTGNRLTNDDFAFLSRDFASCKKIRIAIYTKYCNLEMRGISVNASNSLIKWMLENCPAVGDVAIVLNNLRNLVKKATINRNAIDAMPKAYLTNIPYCGK